ncbi:condensin-2 complex subunit H2 [Porphyrio hochstetteri]
MVEVESRFLHLLQPIQDLTKNWEVDVAAQLGEYLEELDRICISFDDGRTTMNFTEAALLIQGSACIYSRKVEHLYSLVYQALDLICRKRREKQPSSLGQDGRDTDATFGDDAEEFLSLDDISDTSAARVDMKKDPQPNAVNIVPLTPMSLVPLEEAEKRDNPLLSCKGELLASRKDFRMNTSTPHPSGAFVLELAGLSPTLLPQRPAGPSRATVTPAPRPLAGGPSHAPGRLSPGAAPATVTMTMGGSDVPGVWGDPMETSPAAKERVEAQRGYPLRDRAPAKDTGTHIKELLDPWQSIDPFGDSEDKPFRRGRPFQVPQELDEVTGGKRKRRGPRKMQDFLQWFSAAYDSVTDSRKPRSKGPTFADLEVLYWRQLKERVAAQRKLQSRAGPPWPLPCEKLDLLEEERGLDEDDGLGDFMEHEDVELEDLEAPEDRALGPPEPGPLCYEELVRRNVELFIADSQKYAQETELSQHIRRWEDRIGPLLQEQEERASFNIHSYGDALVARLGELGTWQPLAALVAGQPPFEVCRYMLASLQLANDYVVELTQEPGLEEALDTARLRLLTHQRPQDRFHTLPPPCAQP